ncbi:MAG: hypothetical protein Q8916_08430 [Bacteroidota bacterium]|nr:hypothetical protein [Bacteroidota bacterium]
MHKKELIAISQKVLRLSTHYKGISKYLKREMAIDALLYAFLVGKYGDFVKVKRQYQIKPVGSKWPLRIDFRIGGPNPVFIELAVRPPDGNPELYGPSNINELRKLLKFDSKVVKGKFLVLLDLKNDPIRKHNLKLTYDNVGVGKGKFMGKRATVIYVHSDTYYSFSYRGVKGKS